MENALAPAPPDRPRKASPRKRPVKRADRKPLVVGGAVGLVALVCVVGAAVRRLGGTRQAPAGAQAQAQAHADPAGAQAQPDPVARGYSFEAAASTKVPKDPNARLPRALYAFRPSPPPEGPPAAAPAKWPKWTRPVVRNGGAEET
jgi:hypothetical protein